jgi:hypothetical protein
MNKNEMLDTYLIKIKTGSKLNKSDKDSIRRVLKEELRNNELTDELLHYVLRFPAEISIYELSLYYKDIDQIKKREFVRKFFGSKHFVKKNENGEKNIYLQFNIQKSITLIGEIIKLNIIDDNIFFMLREVCKLVLSNDKKTVSQKVVECICKEILCSGSFTLFNSRLNEYDLDQEDLNNLTNVLIKSAFDENQKEIVPDKMQYRILIWLMGSTKKINLDEKMRMDIQNAYLSWSDDLKVIVGEDNELVNAYRLDLSENNEVNNKLNVVINERDIDSNNPAKVSSTLDKTVENKFTKYSESELEVNNLKEGNRSNYEQVQSENTFVNTISKTPYQTSYKGPDTQIIKSLDAIKKYVIESLNERKKIDLEKEENSSLIHTLENEKLILNKRIGRLIEELNDLRNINDKHEIEINELKSDLMKSKQEVLILKEKNEGILKLLEVYKNEDNNSLDEFKVKLAHKLNLYYSDFNDVKNEVMSNELGEHFRFKLEDVFKELKRYGFELE